MAGFYPVPSTRSTNLLQQTRLVQQLNYDQLGLAAAAKPDQHGTQNRDQGEDPAVGSRAQTLQRILELKDQAKTNIQASQSYLDATDTSLSNVAKVLTDIRSAALAANSDTVTDTMPGRGRAAGRSGDHAASQYGQPEFSRPLFVRRLALDRRAVRANGRRRRLYGQRRLAR